MITVCYLWPSISPFNIWDLPIGVWRGFARATDEYTTAAKEAAKHG